MPYTPGRFTATLKKTDAHPAIVQQRDNNAPANHTHADYEALRQLAVGSETAVRFMAESGRTYDEAEGELTLFVLQGAAAWLKRSINQHNERRIDCVRPHQRYYAGNLAVLFANIIESRGE